MSGGSLYFRFVLTLVIGLTGLGMVLTTLFEGILNEWDLPRDLRLWWREFALLRRHGDVVGAEEILLELERNRGGEGRYQRPAAPLDRRREALREVSEAESRLVAPAAPLTAPARA